MALDRAAPPAPAATGRRARLGEALLWSAPAALALVLLAALAQLGPGQALGGWLASLALAALLARARQREVEAVAAWIERLPRNGAPIGPAARGGTLTDRLLRPMGELARVLQRQSRSMAAQQRMLATLIEALPDPILVADRELAVLQSNAAARVAFDVPARPVPLARIARDPALFAAVSGALTGTAAGGFTFSPTHALHKQFSCRIEPVDLGENGEGVLIAMREQTEQVMIERMRSDFVANASHEIRTPLATIQGCIETLRGAARHDPKARETFLEIMTEEAARMARLVDDLLSLSRIELAALQPPEDRCDLAAVLTRVVQRMEPFAAAADVALELAVAGSLPPVVGDADQLHQLIANLVDNAVKYGGTRQPVRIEVTALAAAPDDCGPLAGRPCVRVAVVDHGPGIAPEHLPRLTERFYRVDSARSRRLRGTGLGLAIAKHIVRRHQGHLAVVSELGRGSTFIVLLPSAAGGDAGHGSVTQAP